eukprot:TRINITY_DN35271_c0_g1_i1.p1 TRINITY_DN35271_c0_g1~~TRINITY_DN35271_c0_g1_i1.p1  ORF type:complete len:324 (-),score=54.37 TRINITY_DN35271_c0_g1_i1:117-1088(-)
MAAPRSVGNPVLPSGGGSSMLSVSTVTANVGGASPGGGQAKSPSLAPNTGNTGAGGSGGAGAGGGSLSDMHAAWTSKGAVEFIPAAPGQPVSGVVVPSGTQATPAAPRPMGTPSGQMVGGPAFPGMMQGRWPGMVGGMPGVSWNAPNPMPGISPTEAMWQQSPGGSTSGVSGGAASMPQSPMDPSVFGPGTQGPPPPTFSPKQRSPPQRTPVLVWNLEPSYSKQELEDALLEIDFLPEQVITCNDLLEGSFLFFYAEKHMANAVVVSLDGTREHLRHNGEKLRLAKWNATTSQWSKEAAELPPQLQRSLQERITKELRVQHVI